MSVSEKRDGELELADDPASAPPDASVIFIGVVRSPWISRDSCPKNLRMARETGGGATVEILPPFRAGLAGLRGFSHVHILTWLHRAPRHLIVQMPRHATVAKGVFALRSPARPNPVGLHTPALLGLDIDTGVLTLDAMDVLDGTPVVDVKPYFATVDAFPEATSPKPRDST